MDKVEVAFAIPEKQVVITVTLVEGSTVQQAIDTSGVVNQFSEIDLLSMPVGIFGKICKLDQGVKSGDRVEIYRPLLQNPMDARRNRAVRAA
ncbi:MAG: RnfH family protein [Methylococcaceae bacterium]|nr:RnfH family protein [Methylococcaceae bacterium]